MCRGKYFIAMHWIVCVIADQKWYMCAWGYEDWAVKHVKGDPDPISPLAGFVNSNISY